MSDRAWVPVEGGCLCGAVRYRVEAPALCTNHCHCLMCRKTQAALIGSWSRVPRESIVIEKGEEALTTYRSSEPCIRRFCRHCGGQLFYEHSGEPDAYWYTLATLDGGAHPGHARDQLKHVCVESKPPWHPITDNLPQHGDYADEPAASGPTSLSSVGPTNSDGAPRPGQEGDR